LTTIVLLGISHNAKLGGMHLGRKAAAPITPCVEKASMDAFSQG
jgi:hypothetical protein